MAALLSSGRKDVTAIIAKPHPGDRQPGELIPIPAKDSQGNLVLLYSSLVIDHGDERVIIPDIWEPGWLNLDLARALQDLITGGPLSLGYLDGKGEGLGQLAALLKGRWKVDEWVPGSSAGNSFDILLIRDGAGLEGMENLVPQLQNFLEGGGRILMAGSVSQPHSNVGRWGGLQGEDTGLLFIDDEDFLNPSAYGDGRRSFRDIDTALLLAAGRRDLIGMMVSDIQGAGNPGRGKAGERLLKASLPPVKINFPEAQDITEISFRSGEDSFSLDKKGLDWKVVSGDWELPARREGIESFLSRLETGSVNLWNAVLSPVPGDYPLITFSGSRFKTLELHPVMLRESGGGVYFNTDSSLILWPGLNAADISTDARYWMERRLFPGIKGIIRAELVSDKRLYWRLHQENADWILTDGDGRGRILSEESARDFTGRLLRSEALTLAPGTGSESSPLILRLEDGGGRFTEYRLADIEGGRVAAISLSSGLLYILDNSLVQFILGGPGN